MPLPDGPFIFVSYSSRDSYFVHPEIVRLERQRYRVWYDKGNLQPSRVWAEEIRRAIDACACFMVFITEDAVNSPNVLVEMDQALEARKPFICVYWEKVELPPRFQKPVRRIQALERYALRRHEYEGPLDRALSEHVEKTEIQPGQEDEGVEREPAPPPPLAQPDVLPLIVFFALILSAGASLFVACVAALIPYVGTPRPGDPFNSPLAGFAVSIFFAAVAACLSVGAFAVHKFYLRRRHG